MCNLRTLAALTVAAALPVAAAAAVPIPGAPGELSGSVSRADGTPVRSFTVNGVRFENPRGAFRILVPPEGSFRVVVRAAGLAPSVVHVQGAAGKKLMMPDIVLGRGEDVLGEIVDAQTELPIPGAYVALADPAHAARLRFVRPERLAGVASTGKGGWFMLRGAPRAVLMLVAFRPGYLPEFVPVNTRERLRTIKLHRAAAISGDVRDGSGSPVPGAHVVAVAEDESDAAEAAADVRGHFTIQGLRPGRYTVAVLSPGGPEAGPGPVDAAEGRTASVALEVKQKFKRMNLQQFEIGSAPAQLDGAFASR